MYSSNHTSRHDSGFGSEPCFEGSSGFASLPEEVFGSSSDSESVSPSSPHSYASSVASSLASSPALLPAFLSNSPPRLDLDLPSGHAIASYASQIIRNEAYALLALASRLAPKEESPRAEQQFSARGGESITNVEFRRCVEMLAALPPHGKIIVTGVGKSGIAGRKLVATFCSLGTPAVFLHPLEALHGDLGVICPCSPHSPCDALLLISHSGATAELMRLIPVVRNRVKNLIAITRDSESILAKACNGWLDAGTGAYVPTPQENGGEKATDEADSALPAPTSSVVAALAVGDAVALTLSRMRVGWEAGGKTRRVDFLRNHPGGQIGLNLTSAGERRSK